MKILIKGALLLQGCVWLVVFGIAQAQEDAADVYVYATYMECDLATQDRSDEIFMSLDKPLYDAAVADGTLASYSYYAHQTGGKWRRGLFTVAPSIDALLEAQKKIGDQADKKNKKLVTESSKICNAHEDYIWRSIAGGAGTQEPGKVAFTTYYVCDSREAQADAIMTQVFASSYDKMVADGKLTSWGYLEHVVGGSIRRIETMTAKDMTTLMAARAELIEQWVKNPLGETFSDICDSHDDYMWDVKASASP